MMLNYKVLLIADGKATYIDAEHNATLSAMALTCCDVIDTAEVVSTVNRCADGRAAA